MSHWRLRGTVEPGMFPNERVFVVQDLFGDRYVVVVPLDLVDERDGSVPVRMIHKGDDEALVSVPGESASKAVSVRSSELVEA